MTERANHNKKSFFRLRGRTIHIFGRTVDLPASRLARIVIGLLLIVGGCFSFLPILGIWMLPLGFMVLSIDVAVVRRWRRRAEVRWSRWRAARKLRREAEKESREHGVQAGGTTADAAAARPSSDPIG